MRFSLALVLLTSALAAQAGTFTPFGDGCPGTPTTGDACVTVNASGPYRVAATNASTGYAVLVPSQPGNLAVTGFEMRVRTASLTQQTSVALYDALGRGGSPGVIFAAGWMTVTSEMGWRRAVFQQPLLIPASFQFYLFFQNQITPLIVEHASGGRAVTAFERLNGSWSPSQTTANWAVRVTCYGTPVAPVLSSKDVPTLGKTTTVELSGALSDTMAVLLIGASRRTWSGGPLPFPLQPLGGGTCVLHVSDDILWIDKTDPAGRLGVPLPMPNDATVLGAIGHVQYAVSDPATSLGLVTTNGATMVLGR